MSSALWLRVALYALVGMSAFSILGIEVATVALMWGAIFHTWMGRAEAVPPRFVVLPFVVFGLTLVISTVASEAPLASFGALLGNYRIYLPFAVLPALFVADVRVLLRVLVICIALSALYGFIQYFAGVDWFREEGEKLVRRSMIEGAGVFHAKGTFSHHLTYAGFMLINVPLFLALAILDRTRDRPVWIAGGVCAAAAIVVSMGRSGLLGAMIGCGVLTLMLPRRRSVPILLAAATSLAVVILAMSTGWLQERLSHPDNPVLLKRILSSSPFNDRDRLFLWEAGWLGFVDHAVVGIGLGNERTDFGQYREIVAERHGGHQYMNSPAAGVHNVFLHVAYCLGTLGFAAFSWMFYAIFRYCATGIRSAGDARPFECALLWGAAGGLVGILAAGFFENNYFDAEVQNMVGIAIGLALFAGSKIAISKRTQPERAQADPSLVTSPQ